MANSYIQTSAPLAVMISRLTWHSKPNNPKGLLQGLTYLQVPEWRVEGKDQVPNLTILDYKDVEEIFAGAIEEPEVSRNSVMAPIQTLILMLVNDRQMGLIQPLGGLDGDCRKRGLTDWINLIRDSICRTVNGQADAGMAQTCMRPTIIKTIDSVVRELTWSATIEVTLYPREVVKASRHDKWPDEI